MKETRYKIKLLNNIAQVGKEQLDPFCTYCEESETDPDAILVRSADMHGMEFNKSLLCIGRAGIGVNNIPIERASESGVVVFNTPGANANAVKELAVCAMLLSSRKIYQGIEWAKTLKGTRDIAATVEKGKAEFAGPELKGKSLGVIGLGATGATIANIAYRFGMEVLGDDPYITVENAWTMNRLVQRAISRKEIYQNCDYITLHVPLNNETKHMINVDTIALMKDGVRIINLSRAELVNDDDMAIAIKEGKVACYVTDFPNEKTLEMENAISIPHLGASTPESEDNCAVMAAREVLNYLLYGNISNSVNMPDIEMPFDASYRMLILHRNVPNMVGIISTSFAEAGFNIEHMINRSKGQYAATIVDTNEEIPQAVMDKIMNAPEMLKIRVLAK